MTDFHILVQVRTSGATLDLHTFFDQAVQNEDSSPIEQFQSNCAALNLHWISNSSNDIAGDLGRILLLGYVSAVESYMRALIRQIIIIDKASQKKCEPLSVPYGAVIHNAKAAHLADALLEESMFSSSKGISGALEKFIGISESILVDLKPMLEEFEKICQLRHCCVHRFGIFGIRNAAHFGLSEHNTLLHRPIKMDKPTLERVADLIFNLVKSINNTVFREIMERTLPRTSSTGQSPTIWTWNYDQDKRLFESYYHIFSDKNESRGATETYELFKQTAAARKPKDRPSKP